MERLTQTGDGLRGGVVGGKKQTGLWDKDTLNKAWCLSVMCKRLNEMR